MNPTIRAIKNRIYEEAPDGDAIQSLRVDDMYGAPYSFWSNALGRGLVTKDEFEAAQRSYGSLWHYRGD
jgi:hypothetical protein